MEKVTACAACSARTALEESMRGGNELVSGMTLRKLALVTYSKHSVTEFLSVCALSEFDYCTGDNTRLGAYVKSFQLQ